MHIVDFVFLAGWIAFWVYWLSQSFGVKAGKMNWGRFAGFRVAIAVLVLLVARFGVFRSHSVTTSPLLQGIGLALFVLGLGLAVWARLYLGRNWGMPMSQKDDPELVTAGPYRFARHPIYGGLVLAVLGTALATNLIGLAVTVVVAANFAYCARVEERNLTTTFPDAYPAYRERTKMLIPFVF
jgi:protein-S-isoprenylcysteine O-methyltransferase Ste14